MLNCTILFQNPTMPNRSCDFCLNDYKKEPNVGYFKFSDYMKITLDMTEVKADLICGLHFDNNSFLKNGRLTFIALPTFFPKNIEFYPKMVPDICDISAYLYICICHFPWGK